MASRGRRRRRVPEVLRRAYGDSVRTLKHTILFLLPSPAPPSPSECRCRGRICLSCGRRRHLLRPGDPPDYRRLLSHGFCVLSSDVQQPPRLFHPCNLPQRTIVKNSLELIMDRSEGHKNLLCNGYDKLRQWSPSVELLCNSAWELLLMRIGDPLMAFLLQFSSIFLPLRNRSHHQVTGVPVHIIFQSQNRLLKPSAVKQQSRFMGKLSQSYGHSSKRRRVDFEEGPLNVSFHIQQLPAPRTGGLARMKEKDCQNLASHNNLMDCSVQVGHDTCPLEHPDGQDASLFHDSRKSIRLQSQCTVTDPILVLEQEKSFCRYNESTSSTSAFAFKSKKLDLRVADSACSKQKDGASEAFDADDLKNPRNPRKRTRPFSWQRHRKKRSMDILGNENSFGTIFSHQSFEPSRLINHDLLTEVHKESTMSTSAFESLTDLQAADSACSQEKDGASQSFDTDDLRKYRNSKKHKRPFSWQRCRIKKNMGILGENVANETSFSNEGLKVGPNPTVVTVFSHQSFEPSRSINCGSLTERASCCIHCLMLQTRQKLTVEAHISRRGIFYSKRSSYLLLSRDMNRLRPNDVGAAYLMEQIFGLTNRTFKNSCSCDIFGNCSALVSKCLYHSLLGSFKSLIRNTQRCQFRKLLRKHCSGPMLKKFSKDKGGITSEVVEPSGVCDDLFDQIECYCRYDQVVSFIWAVARNILPLDLLGYSSTWRALRTNISKFVRLRRFENLSLKHCLHGLKTSCFPFVSAIRHSFSFCENLAKDKAEVGREKRKEDIMGTDEKMTVCHKLFQSWIFWFFSYIVVPIIASNFYVTERESGKQDVFYYLKPTWRNIVGKAVVSLGNRNFKLVDNAHVAKVLSGKQRPFGFSKVRFLPKEKNLRPLANLKAPSKLRLFNSKFGLRNFFPVGDKYKAKNQKSMERRDTKEFKHFKSVNCALRDLYAILKNIAVEEPHKLGSSVFDYNNIYKKLLHFHSKVKLESDMKLKIYIVVADVSKAFDSIEQDLLIKVMKDVMHKDEYVIRGYTQIICKKSPQILHKVISFDVNGIGFDVIRFEATCSRPSGCILIHKGTIRKIKGRRLHEILHEHVKRNILLVNHSFYMQKVGISQGSCLSSLLCSFYYGHLERSLIFPYLEKARERSNAEVGASKEWVTNGDIARRVTSRQSGNEVCDLDINNAPFPGESSASDSDEDVMLLEGWNGYVKEKGAETSVSSLNENKSLPNYLLLRQIDDYLFISTSKTQAANFLNRIRRGFRKHNCYMNDDKFGLNFEMDQGDLRNRVYRGADGISFLPWSGLLVNCQTMEIQADYTRYWGSHLRSCITIPVAKAVHHLKTKLCAYTRPKCHPIFYDSKINSLATITLNSYQVFLLCAMKFHCYVCGMPAFAPLNPSYFLDIIQESLSYMYQHIKKRMHDMELEFNIHSVLPLRKAEIIWLGLSAYIRVLKRKQSHHKELVSLLRSKLACYGRMGDNSPHLKYAVDDSHSSLFWKIKY